MRTTFTPDRFIDDHFSHEVLLTREKAIVLGQKLLTMVGERSSRIIIQHTKRAVSRVTNNQVLNTDDGDRINIWFDSVFGTGVPVSISANQINDITLERVVSYVKSLAPPRPGSGKSEPNDPDDPQYYTYNQRKHLDVSLWHDTTINAMNTMREDVIPKVIKQLQTENLMGAATVGLSARSALYLYKQGLTAFSEETDCEVTVTARTNDGAGSGWAGQASRNWSAVSYGNAVLKATDLANRSRNSVALEPGRRVVILGPAAVAQLVSNMAEAFNGLSTRRGQTPFTYPNKSEGRMTKLGLRVFDPRITMVSNPADPEGGFPPFFELGSIEPFVHGYPVEAVTWVEHGVLRNLAYGAGDAVARRLPACDLPRSIHLAVVNGTKTAGLDDMISNCQEGIYINRFSNVVVLDWKTGMMTGVTRDGCFLIKNGKLDKSVKNFRFMESPFIAFNNIEMIGDSERVAFGYSAPPGATESQSVRWPRLPVIVPPMMIRDFNLSGLADAI